MRKRRLFDEKLEITTTAHLIEQKTKPSWKTLLIPLEISNGNSKKEKSMKQNTYKIRFAVVLLGAGLIVSTPFKSAETSSLESVPVNQVLEWNQIFIDTLIATNTANSSSQRLGAIVHTAIFDAYNGIERRYSPVFVQRTAPSGASRRAAVIAAAYTALVGLFPTQKASLDASYAASLEALS